MGSEQSQISGLELEEKAVEVTDFWTHHSAAVNSGNFTNLSVFIGEPLVGGSLWMSQTPLEKASKVRTLYSANFTLKTRVFLESYAAPASVHFEIRFVLEQGL